MASIREGMLLQGSEVEVGSDEYWRLIADIAIEAVVWNQANQAEEWRAKYSPGS